MAIIISPTRLGVSYATTQAPMTKPVAYRTPPVVMSPKHGCTATLAVNKSKDDTQGNKSKANQPRIAECSSSCHAGALVCLSLCLYAEI